MGLSWGSQITLNRFPKYPPITAYQDLIVFVTLWRKIWGWERLGNFEIEHSRSFEVGYASGHPTTWEKVKKRLPRPSFEILVVYFGIGSFILVEMLRVSDSFAHLTLNLIIGAIFPSLINYYFSQNIVSREEFQSWFNMIAWLLRINFCVLLF